ncbi:MAG: hypothetical protein DRP42_06720, partial [Tenericutes bacterium]
MGHRQYYWAKVSEYIKLFPYKEIPFIMSHPLFSSPTYYDMKTGKLIIITNENFERLVKKRLSELRPMFFKSPQKFILNINKPYMVDVFSMIDSHFDDKEFNMWFHYIWTRVEFPHQMG